MLTTQLQESFPHTLAWCFGNMCSGNTVTHRSKEKKQGMHVCCSVNKLCPTLCDPMDYSTPGSPVLHCLSEFAQIHVHWGSMLSNHLILCCPLLLLPSVFPSIRVFSSELAFCIRWSKYWSFSISASNQYSGLISFRKSFILYTG